MLAACVLIQLLIAAGSADPFAFFQPTVTLGADDRRQLDRGEPVAGVLSGSDGEVAVFAAVRIRIDGDRLVAWMRRIEALKKSSYVLAIGRFSDPPRIEDLAGLALDDDDLSDIMACRPAHCELQLSAAEMIELQRAAASAGSEWKPRVQQAFRRLLLQRVTVYLAHGNAALPVYDNHADPRRPEAAFEALLGRCQFLTDRLPRFAAHLRGYPRTAMPDVESFVYWSKEHIAGKSIVSATHVSILRGDGAGLPDALVAGKEIFATHYVEAALGLTSIVRGEPGGADYLVYVNRSAIDLPGGIFSGVVKWIVQRRVKREAGEVLVGLRRRLESGEPPAAAGLPAALRHREPR